MLVQCEMIPGRSRIHPSPRQGRNGCPRTEASFGGFGRWVDAPSCPIRLPLCSARSCTQLCPSCTGTAISFYFFVRVSAECSPSGLTMSSHCSPLKHWPNRCSRSITLKVPSPCTWTVNSSPKHRSFTPRRSTCSPLCAAGCSAPDLRQRSPHACPQRRHCTTKKKVSFEPQN